VRNEKGFIPIIILLVLAVVVGVGTVAGYPYIEKIINKATQPDSFASPSPTSVSEFTDLISTPSPGPLVSSPTPKATSKSSAATKTPTPKPTSGASTNTTSNASSCNYNLSSATGAVQFIFNPSGGSSLYWSTVGEIKALNGCRVLDGKSTDTIQRFKSSGSNSLSIPSIPAGTYQVRYSYHNSWSSTQTISVSSGQQTNVTFSVNNSSDPAPTPTPNQKPSCSLTYMNISGTQKVCVGITSNPTGSIISEYVDYEGDGSWDYSGPQYGCHDYAYTTGTHTAKAKVLGSPGTIGNESDICQTTFTVN